MPTTEAGVAAVEAAESGSACATSASGGRQYLMCPPSHFAVTYSINPWMDPSRPVDGVGVMAQWQRLHDQLLDLGHQVHLAEPAPGLPDMVFAANGGIVIGDRALVPRFRHLEREQEAAHFARTFAELGVGQVQQATRVNEGEGDFLLIGDLILGGSGFRSDRGAAEEVAEFFGLPVVPLRLVDPRFYHLDTALAKLSDELVAYWPGAFDANSRGVLRDLFPTAVLADEHDAAALGLNIVSDGTTVIMTPECDTLARRIVERGFRAVSLATDGLRRAGGGAKCCVLELHATPARMSAAAPATR